MRKVYIYALVDPKTNIIRYVGKTVNPEKRLDAHLKDTKSNHQKTLWIEKLAQDGIIPIMKILEECDSYNWSECEKRWIKHLREIGLDLLNVTDGGEPGGRYTSIDSVMKKIISREKWVEFCSLNKSSKVKICSELTIFVVDMWLAAIKLNASNSPLFTRLTDIGFDAVRGFTNKLISESL